LRGWKLHADRIGRWVPSRFVPLGTDGFGVSDTREGLRRQFEVDAQSVVLASRDALSQQGRIGHSQLVRAIGELGLDPNKGAPKSV
jgi:pyruvate dehydrogenase E1 component